MIQELIQALIVLQLLVQWCTGCLARYKVGYIDRLGQIAWDQRPTLIIQRVQVHHQFRDVDLTKTLQLLIPHSI